MAFLEAWLFISRQNGDHGVFGLPVQRFGQGNRVLTTVSPLTYGQCLPAAYVYLVLFGHLVII